MARVLEVTQTALAVLAMQIVLFALPIIRGHDYGTGDTQETARRLGTVEMAAPLEFWGYAFTIAGCLGLIGLLLKSWKFAFWGHVLCWALYWAVGVGIFTDVFNRQDDFVWSFNPIMLLPLAVAALSVYLAVRSRDDLTVFVAVGVVIAAVVAMSTSSFDGLRNASVLAGMGCAHAVFAFSTAQTERMRKLGGVIAGD